MNEEEEKDINNYYEGQKNLEKTDKIVSFAFIVYDYILIILCFLIIKSKDKNIKIFKYKLYSLFIIDSILLLLYLILYHKLESLPNELFFSLLYSCEFLLIISFLKQINSNYNPTFPERNKNINPFKQCLICLFITFSYDKFLSSQQNIIAILESLLIFKFLAKLDKYMENTFNQIDIIIRKHINKRDFSYDIMNSPFFILVFIFAFYCLNLLNKLIKDKDILFFVIMIKNAIKMVIKFLVFLVLFILVFIFDEIVLKEEKYKIYIVDEEKNRFFK